MLNNGVSLADIAAVTDRENGNGGGWGNGEGWQRLATFTGDSD